MKESETQLNLRDPPPSVHLYLVCYSLVDLGVFPIDEAEKGFSIVLDLELDSPQSAVLAVLTNCLFQCFNNSVIKLQIA